MKHILSMHRHQQQNSHGAGYRDGYKDGRHRLYLVPFPSGPEPDDTPYDHGYYQGFANGADKATINGDADHRHNLELVRKLKRAKTIYNQGELVWGDGTGRTVHEDVLDVDLLSHLQRAKADVAAIEITDDEWDELGGGSIHLGELLRRKGINNERV